MIGLEEEEEEETINLTNVLLNAQDKVNCNKITEIREERNANLIYIGSATSHTYV